MKKNLILFIKGIIIGIALLIPGLSGGTAAIALGIYEETLVSTAEYFKSVKKNTVFLLTVVTGSIIGAIVFSKPLHYFSDSYPFFSRVTFCLIALLSLFVFLQKSISGRITTVDFLLVLAGMVPAALISIALSGDALSVDNKLFLFPIGILLAVALVLPAISFSYMLLFFGIYDDCLIAISTLDFGFLSVLGLGILTGTLLCAKVFLFFIRRAPRPTYLIIAGFVFYSVFDIII